MQMISESGTLLLRGDFDVRSTAEVRDALRLLLECAEPEVVVDLSGVESIDVCALRVLAVASRIAHRRGGHLVLRGCGRPVRRLLHLTRLAAAVEVERAAATA